MDTNLLFDLLRAKKSAFLGDLGCFTVVSSMEECLNTSVILQGMCYSYTNIFVVDTTS
jgi:hypothetical protein